MSKLLKQSSTAQPLMFFMADSADGKSGKTGLSPTVTLSKSGGSFASPSGTVTEIASGWYKVAGNATDTNTLGPLILHATGTGADPTEKEYEIVAFDPQSANAMITGINGIAPPTGWNLLTYTGTPTIGGTGTLTITGAVATQAGTLPITTTQMLLSAGTGTGQLALRAGRVTPDGPGKNRWYVALATAGGSDSNDGKSWSTPFLTLNKARTVAVAGDSIEIGPGDFDEGTVALSFAANVSIKGAGMNRTNVYGSRAFSSGAILVATSGLLVEDLAVQDSVLDGTARAPFGTGFFDSTFSGRARLRRVRLVGEADGIFLSSMSASAVLDCEDVTVETKYDCIRLTSSGTINFDGRLIATGPSANSGGVETRAIAVDAGTVNISARSTITAAGASTRNYGVWTNGAGAVVNVAEGARVRTTGTGATDLRADTGVINEFAADFLTQAGTVNHYAANAIKAKTDNLPADPASNTQVNTRAAPGDAMTLTAGERTAINTTLTTAHGSGAWTGSGSGGTGSGTGNVVVDHNYGGTDALRVLKSGVPVDDALISAYVASDYTAGLFNVVASQYTGTDGRWNGPMNLDPDSYKLVVSKPGVIQDKVVDLVVV